MLKRIALAAPLALACITTAQAADCDLSQPPGWVCNQIAQAIGPAPGWHGEADKVTGRTIMIPDNQTAHEPLTAVRTEVIDTARSWHLLSRSEQEAIHHGEKIIDDFIHVTEEPGCREQNGGDTLFCRDTYTRLDQQDHQAAEAPSKETSPAMGAEKKIALCHAGLIKLKTFAEHIKFLRRSPRGYPTDELREEQRKGGPEFFSSQIIVQESYSGSGTFDLRMFHGLFEPQYYRNVTAWDCQLEDFPIVHFIGFRVRKIEDGTIFVSREKDIVNVISLKAPDPDLDKHIKVQLFENPKVLCPDIATGCDQRIFYSRE